MIQNCHFWTFTIRFVKSLNYSNNLKTNVIFPFLIFVFVHLFFLRQSFSMLCPGWPQTQTHVSPTSASQMLRLEVLTTMPAHLSFSRWANSSRLRGAKFWYQKTELVFKHGPIWVFGLFVYLDKVSLGSPSWPGSIYCVDQIDLEL